MGIQTAFDTVACLLAIPPGHDELRWSASSAVINPRSMLRSLGGARYPFFCAEPVASGVVVKSSCCSIFAINSLIIRMLDEKTARPPLADRNRLRARNFRQTTEMRAVRGLPVPSTLSRNSEQTPILQAAPRGALFHVCSDVAPLKPLKPGPGRDG
jgi:hypothetical protein